jgi:hypothetical protein
MSDDRLPDPTGNPTFIKRIGSFLLIIPSAIIGILLVELFYQLFLPPAGDAESYSKALHRVTFFEGYDTTFQNHGDIFTYVPHADVRNLTAIFSENNFKIEQDYYFRTNNLGLVQDADVIPERESLLLLGDSFTQGQGAEPWFRLISPEIEKLGYQAVNGGLLGTGFEQWLKLDRFLAAKNVQIRKLVVLFISLDYNRPVWNFSPAVLQCLSALPLCKLEESLFYRLPPLEELSSWIAKVRTTRAPMTKAFWLEARAEALLPASTHVFKYFSSWLRDPTSAASKDRAEQQSRAAISELIRIYGPANVAFIHLPQKDESHGPSSLGLRARRSIQEAGGKMFDGFELCRLTAADYYSNDDHPNGGGYVKIALCVSNMIKKMIAETQ